MREKLLEVRSVHLAVAVEIRPQEVDDPHRTVEVQVSPAGWARQVFEVVEE